MDAQQDEADPLDYILTESESSEESSSARSAVNKETDNVDTNWAEIWFRNNVNARVSLVPIAVHGFVSEMKQSGVQVKSDIKTGWEEQKEAVQLGDL